MNDWQSKARERLYVYHSCGRSKAAALQNDSGTFQPPGPFSTAFLARSDACLDLEGAIEESSSKSILYVMTMVASHYT